MTEEKSSLLGYLLCSPEEQQQVFCREMHEDRRISDYTFADLMQDSSALGQYLKDGEEWGEHIPLFLDTSYDFLRTFLGVLAAKRISVPVHTNANDGAIEFILRKVRARCLVVTQPWLYAKLVKINYVHEHIHTILTTPEVIEQKALPCRHINIHDVFAHRPSAPRARHYLGEIVSQTKADDPMQIVFTSGTTGEPKGALLSHKNLISCVVRAGNHLNIDSSYRTLTFLPLSHVMAQNEVFIGLVKRSIIQIVGRDNLLHGLKTFEPNILVSVPRVYQAVHDGIQRKLRSKRLARHLLNLCVKAYTTGKRSRSWWKRWLGRAFACTLGKLITAKVRENIGKFKLLVTAGAACPEFIYDFFETVGLPLTNAQGLTEVSGAIIYNNPNETLNCSIGYPLPGVEAKVDDDGEILIKGDPVFSGYFEEPLLNHTSFTEDGWFKTGDLGEMQILDGKPYLFLKGRKKEILVLSSGLNIPAQQIEERLMQHELIHQAMVVGDGKPRLAALIVPNDEYTNNADLRSEISKIIREVNNQMDASEHINQFEILPEPFTIENGMLTPTLKIRRPVVFKRYEQIIGQLYNSPA